MYKFNLYGQHLRRHRPDITVNTGIGADFFAMTIKRFAFGGNIGYNSKFRDFFEPRAEDTYVTYDPFSDMTFFVSSDYRKQFAYDVRLRYEEYFNSSQNLFTLSIEPRFRFSDQFNMIYEFQYRYDNDRNSFVGKTDEDIIFGERDQKSIENSLNGNYNFNNKQGLNLSFRHFWSTARFTDDKFTKLVDNGNLRPVDYNATGDNDPDANFNIWNLDLSYRWQFAPGSEAVLLYRNSIFNEDDLSYLGFSESLDNLFARPARHNLSLRIVYFLDYNQVRNLFRS